MEDPDLLEEGWQSRLVQLKKVRLHYVTAGKGEPVILLHGFPEFWYAWKNQIGELAKHFHVIAPDLRGYNLSEKPEGQKHYTLLRLAHDIKELIEKLGYQKAMIVGHDWGALIGWSMAHIFPKVVKKLGIISVMHPALLVRDHNRSLAVRLAWWHLKTLQIPRLPEWILPLFHFALFTPVFHFYAGRHKQIKPYLAAVKRSFARHKALPSALNYYRENIDSKLTGFAKFEGHKIQCPVYLIYGKKDLIWPKAHQNSLPEIAHLIDNTFEYVEFPEAGHWIMHEEPELTTEHLLGFLKKG